MDALNVMTKMECEIVAVVVAVDMQHSLHADVVVADVDSMDDYKVDSLIVVDLMEVILEADDVDVIDAVAVVADVVVAVVVIEIFSSFLVVLFFFVLQFYV